MTGPLPQLAKREMQRFFAPRGVWIATVSAGVILGLTGAWGTDEAWALVPRVAYWVVVASVTFLTGTILGAFVIGWFSRRSLPRWQGILCASLLSGTVIFLEVVGLQFALFQTFPGSGSVAAFALNIFVTVAVITVAYFLLTPVASDVKAPPRLMARLPLHKRGALVSVSVEDHYVEVTTTTGREMILLRFGDAMAETEPTSGLQIHRSHWVAIDQITAVHRKDGKTLVDLTDARSLPVSRTFLPALKDAGLLPRSGS